jgi:hypothetical protein
LLVLVLLDVSHDNPNCSFNRDFNALGAEVTGHLVIFSLLKIKLLLLAAAGIQVYAWKGLMKLILTGVSSKHYSLVKIENH